MTVTERIRRIQLTLGTVGILVGVIAFVQASNVAFRADVGAELGWPSYELRLMSYNRLGALVTLGLAVVGLTAALVRRPSLGWVAAGGFGLFAVQVLIQWRPDASNLLGSRGSNLAFALLMSLGFGVTAVLANTLTTATATAMANEQSDPRKSVR